MTAVNQAAGPAGAAPAASNGTVKGEPLSNRQQLNTYIYDYLLKNEHYGLARALQKELPIYAAPQARTSPGRRDVNGIDESMENESKEDPHKRPDDLPLPSILDNTEGSFLYDWWCQFWDIWSAHRRKIPPGAPASQYLANAQVSYCGREHRRCSVSNTFKASKSHEAGAA